MTLAYGRYSARVKDPDGNVSLPDTGSCTSSALYSTTRGSEKNDKHILHGLEMKQDKRCF